MKTLPWRAKRIPASGGQSSVSTQNGEVLFLTNNADADFIVKAVNSHAPMLALLRECERELSLSLHAKEFGTTIARIRATLEFGS